MTSPRVGPAAPAGPDEQWWREAVVYQVYPRSFADADGDGIGDLRGITARLGYLAELGVDALWICPFYPSGGVDGGYDIVDHTGVDPAFGSVEDAIALVDGAHRVGLRVMVDLVPNHVSDAHPWFRAALAGGPGAPERARFHVREGRGPGGHEPPSNWRSVFGGSSWTRIVEPDGTPGPWYYHLFAAEQPDLDWSHPDVPADLERVVRCWLDRGVDGFRIDVSDALIKDRGFPDTPDGSPVIPKDESSGVHEVYRSLRTVLDAYPGARAAVVETGAPDEVVALFVRPDEMHLAFGFRFLHAGWSAPELRSAITGTLAANAGVGAPSSWVTDNHDTQRSVTRYGRDVRLTGAYVPTALAAERADASGSVVAQERPDGGPTADAELLARGTRRARAMAVLLLSLPGAAFVYAGQELGLPEVTDLPWEVLQDPAVLRSGGAERGRDGCRVPMPWSGGEPPFGFSASGRSWLPVPDSWRGLTVEAQEADERSMLRLYRRMLRLRRAQPSLRRGGVRLVDEDAEVLKIVRSAPGGDALMVVVNLGTAPAPLPRGALLLSSDPDASRTVDDSAVHGDRAASDGRASSRDRRWIGAETAVVLRLAPGSAGREERPDPLR